MKFIKYILAILLLLVPLSVLPQTPVDGVCISLISPESKSLSWENDSISFLFQPDEYFWDVTITNKSTTNLKCLWNETLFIIEDISSHIIFDNTTMMLKNEPMPVSTVSPATKIRKSIFPLENFGSSAANPVFTKRIIKKYGDRTVTLIFPVQFDQKQSSYTIKFNISNCK